MIVSKGGIKRTATRLMIALITFVLGLAVSVFFVFRHEKSRVREKVEKPQDGQKLETLSICEVRAHSAYEGRRVRLIGTLVGFHELVLYDPSCKSPNHYVRVDLDQSSRAELVRRAGWFESGGLRQGNFFLKVQLIGRLESIVKDNENNFHSSYPEPLTNDTRLIVFSIEDVEPLQE